MRFPRLSPLGFLSMVTILGSPSRAEAFDPGVEDPFESISMSEYVVSWEAEAAQPDSEAFPDHLFSIEKILPRSGGGLLWDDDHARVTNGNRVIGPSVFQDEYVLLVPPSIKGIFGLGPEIHLAGSEGVDQPRFSTDAYKPMPVPLPPGGLVLAIGATVIGSFRRSRVQ